MKRREVLASSPLFLLTGCLENFTGKQNPTSSPTKTVTSTPQRPEVKEVNLVTEWKQFEDVLDKEIQGAGRGATITIGYRYGVQIHDGTHDVTKQVRIYDSSGNRVNQKSSEDRQLVDSSGYQVWEGAFYFDTASWELGDYKAEVIVRDNVGQSVSASESGEFSINSTLGTGEAHIVAYQGPDSIKTSESYSFSLEIENTTNRDSSIVSPLSVSRNQSDWYKYPDSQFIFTIPSGKKRTWESSQATAPTEPGTYDFRIDDLGETWSFDVV